MHGTFSHPLRIRVSPEHKVQLQAVAKAMRRNPSDTVRILIEDAYAELPEVKQGREEARAILPSPQPVDSNCNWYAGRYKDV